MTTAHFNHHPLVCFWLISGSLIPIKKQGRRLKLMIVMSTFIALTYTCWRTFSLSRSSPGKSLFLSPRAKHFPLGQWKPNAFELTYSLSSDLRTLAAHFHRTPVSSVIRDGENVFPIEPEREKSCEKIIWVEMESETWFNLGLFKLYIPRL